MLRYGPVVELRDQDLDALLAADPEQAWRVFVDRYTPTLLALIERADIVDRDEAMDLYVLVCERLSHDDCGRLRRRDASRGSLEGWLAVVVRNVAVDWVRSRAGRRRLFGAVKRLTPFDQRVFELYYWEHHTPSEVAGLAGARLTDVLDALARVDGALTARHRSELVSLTARSTRPMALDAPRDTPMDIVDESADPEAPLRLREEDAAFTRAIAALPAEDAAIVRLKFIQGLSNGDIRRALHLDRLPETRVAGILARLRKMLQPAPAMEGGYR